MGALHPVKNYHLNLFIFIYNIISNNIFFFFTLSLNIIQNQIYKFNFITAIAKVYSKISYNSYLAA